MKVIRQGKTKPAAEVPRALFMERESQAEHGVGRDASPRRPLYAVAR